ncbi:MAG: hypothetical protein IMW97_02270 [Firmicutes bacterium]|nr:hypothetical protein [Candidatus Fermentithermobacillaceae bacterium]
MATNDPYVKKLVTTDFYAQKLPLKGRIVAVLRGTVEGRNLELIPQPSRAVKAGEIHEFIATCEDVAPGSKVSQIAYLCFVEFETGGILLRGDEVVLDGKVVGTIAGFDMSHQPNHMNIVVKVESLLSGEDRGLKSGAAALIRMPAAVRPLEHPANQAGRS